MHMQKCTSFISLTASKGALSLAANLFPIWPACTERPCRSSKILLDMLCVEPCNAARVLQVLQGKLTCLQLSIFRRHLQDCAQQCMCPASNSLWSSLGRLYLQGPRKGSSRSSSSCSSSDVSWRSACTAAWGVASSSSITALYASRMRPGTVAMASSDQL